MSASKSKSMNGPSGKAAANVTTKDARCASCGHGDGRSYGHGLPDVRGSRAYQCESKVPTGAYYDAGRVYGIDRIPQRWEGRTRCPCPAFVPPKEEP